LKEIFVCRSKKNKIKEENAYPQKQEFVSPIPQPSRQLPNTCFFADPPGFDDNFVN
jgi:hypothetical protein